MGREEEAKEGKGGKKGRKELGCRQRIAAAAATGSKPAYVGEVNGTKFCVTFVKRGGGRFVRLGPKERERLGLEGKGWRAIRIPENVGKTRGTAMLLHELGHAAVKSKDPPNWSRELLAWKEAFRYAELFPEVRGKIKEDAAGCLATHLADIFVKEVRKGKGWAKWVENGGSATFPFVEGAKRVLGEDVAQRLQEKVQFLEELGPRLAAGDKSAFDEVKARMEELNEEEKGLWSDEEVLTAQDARMAVERALTAPPERVRRGGGMFLLGDLSEPELERYHRAEAAADIRSDLKIAYGLQIGRVNREFPSWIVMLDGQRCRRVDGKAFPTRGPTGHPIKRPTHEVRFTDDDVLAMINVHLLSLYKTKGLEDFLSSLSRTVSSSRAGGQTADYFGRTIVANFPTDSALYYSVEEPKHAHFMPGPPRERVRIQLLSRHPPEAVDLFVRDSVANVMPREEELLALAYGRMLENKHFRERARALISVWRS